MPLQLVRSAIAAADVRSAVRFRRARALHRFDANEGQRKLDDAIALLSSIEDAEMAASKRFVAAPLAATVSYSSNDLDLTSDV